VKYCIFLVLAALPALAADRRDDPFRLGNLVVMFKGTTETRVLPNPSLRGDLLAESTYRLEPALGKHFVVAQLYFKNAGSLPNCTGVTAELRADYRERIEQSFRAAFGERDERAFWFLLSGEPLDKLAPGKAIDVDYAFEVKDEAKSFLLVLEPSSRSDCRYRFSPPIPKVDAKTVEIPLNSQKDKPAVLAPPPAISSTPTPATNIPPPNIPNDGGCSSSAGGFGIGGGVSAPVPIYQPEPEYTEEARKAKWQGTVLLSAVIDESGKAVCIKVTKSLGLGLDQKAIEVVQKWRFKPGMKNGKPVSVMAPLEVNFRLL
jgi:TonB family protein